MRPQWKTAVGLLAAAGALAVAACSSGSGTNTAADTPLNLPPASAFKTGTCATIATPVLAIGRFTHDKAKAETLTVEDRKFLVDNGELVKAELAKADKALSDQMLEMLVSIGFVRIQIGKTYKPELLAEVENQRTKLQTMCTN
ncbi:MAG TPA: hypothetical protein VFC00_35120 [Micromonosporaceae bacterium]|nr:hypothetical protein [Micromonosporaceae bacterium]